MSKLSDFIANDLDQVEAGKVLGAQMGAEIKKRAKFSIPRLDVQVRKTPTNGVPNSIIVKLMNEREIGYLNQNPIIVLMRKKNGKKTKKNGVIVKHGKNKWVETPKADFKYGIRTGSWFTPLLLSISTEIMNVDYLINPFVHDLSSENNPCYKLMTSGKAKKIDNTNKVGNSLFGLAIRIDNPNFTGGTLPICTMYQHEPKYIYGEITKILFRLELKEQTLLKSVAIL